MSMLQRAPRFDVADAVRLARGLYGLEATARPLPSERDQNFALNAAAACFVLKIANATESRALLEAENAAMSQVTARGGKCPRVLPAIDGREIVEHEGHLVRLLTWVPGRTLASVRHHSPGLLEDLGHCLGQLDHALGDFDHPATHRDFHWDLAAAHRTIREYLPFISDVQWRGVVEREADGVERRQQPDSLRRSVIHNDANDHNVIAGGGGDLYSRNQRVTGIIDFGDLVYSYTVADLAVVTAYGALDKPDPLGAAARIVQGYHAAHAVLEPELAQLWDLVRLRLCLSACIAAHQQRQRPGDNYLAVSQDPIRRTLPRLARIHHRFAEATFRAVCGMVPVPRRDRVAAWLRGPGRATLKSAVVDGHDRALALDLSVGSPLIAGDPAANAEPDMTARIQQAMRVAGAAVGIGGYQEARSLYSSSLFAAPTEGEERRTIHLGIDLFAPPGTPVRAPLSGVVHAVADNRTPLDYGPVMMLRHETDDGDPFFTLYAHLTRESIAGLEIGQRIEPGDVFAAIGAPEVNGGWTPHLHLQVIIDALDLGTDFPGVCRPGERTIWGAFSPDPDLVLRVWGAIAPARDRPIAQAIATRRAHVGSNVRVGYRTPVTIVRGWMQYLYDHTGRRFLDAYNNVPHVGHCHARVVSAAADQTGVLNTNTRYLHDSLGLLAERVTATLPEPLRVCYFVNSGSEANELALRLARAHTRRHDVVVLESAYHGNTTTLTDISPYKFNGPGGTGRTPWVHVVPLPDVFRGRYKRDDRDAGLRFADAVGATTHALGKEGARPAAFIAETCPSVGGQIVFPPGYLKAAYAHIRAAGGVCIADEVQTAYGRIGTSFYAFEDQQVVPDIVVLGKPIGNGYPLGAVVTTEEIAASFDNGMDFFSTFGGSTVSCAVGLAVLDVVQDEHLQAHAARVGGRLFELLSSMGEQHLLVGDVRGSGLFVGVELVRDGDTLEPAREEADYVVNRLREEGILIGTDGPFHNVLKIRPPMPFDERDAELLVSTLDRVLGELVT